MLKTTTERKKYVVFIVIANEFLCVELKALSNEIFN